MPTLTSQRSDELTKQQRSFLARAARLAEDSQVSQRHGAIVVKGGSVLSSGVNSYSNNPRMFPVDHFAEKKLPHMERANSISVHAEIAAMRRVSPEHLRGSIVYVARLTSRDELGNSQPCEHCASELAKAGVKRVVFT